MRPAPRSPPPPPCIPLNVHSYYSFLDSTLSIGAIVDLAKQHELPAIALTDKNNLHGAVEFAQAAAQAGIKPIIGAELEWPGRRLCLYVENQTGYHNLCRILSAAAWPSDPPHSQHPPPITPRQREQQRAAFDNLDDFRFADRRASIPPLCERGGDGSSPEAANACDDRGRAVPTPFMATIQFSPFHSPDQTAGLLAVSPFAELAPFFPGRFYLETHAPEALEKRAGSLPAVASLPVHYAQPADRWKYDVLQSIRTLTLLRQSHPQKRLAGEYHFRSARDWQRRFAARPELLAHSRELADRCSFAFLLGYGDANSFSRAFHGWEGTSPGEWRTRHRTAHAEVPAH